MKLLGLILPPWVPYVAVALLVAAVWGHGYTTGNARGVRNLEAYKADQVMRIARRAAQQAEVTERVVKEYVRVAGATRVVTETITDEVIKYVAAHPGDRCIDGDWVGLHNAAAANTIPAGGFRLDGALPAAGASVAAGAGGGGAGSGDAKLQPPPPMR
jgi:hypothetical protein